VTTTRLGPIFGALAIILYKRNAATPADSGVYLYWVMCSIDMER